MFAPVYWHLARVSLLHPQMTQAQVDGCDVSTVAMYLGKHPEDPDDEFGPMTGDFAADAARLNARRIAEAQAAAEAVAH